MVIQNYLWSGEKEGSAVVVRSQLTGTTFINCKFSLVLNKLVIRDNLSSEIHLDLRLFLFIHLSLSLSQTQESTLILFECLTL